MILEPYVAWLESNFDSHLKPDAVAAHAAFIADYREGLELPLVGALASPATESCVDRDRELTAGEIAALGLDTRCRWFACKTGEHKAHRQCQRKRS